MAEGILDRNYIKLPARKAVGILAHKKNSSYNYSLFGLWCQLPNGHSTHHILRSIQCRGRICLDRMVRHHVSYLIFQFFFKLLTTVAIAVVNIALSAGVTVLEARSPSNPVQVSNEFRECAPVPLLFDFRMAVPDMYPAKKSI
jgi:hypothetical protein